MGKLNTTEHEKNGGLKEMGQNIETKDTKDLEQLNFTEHEKKGFRNRNG